jgi:hypothetical protein
VEGLTVENHWQRELGAASAQMILIAVLLWMFFTGETDATATSVDWGLVALVVAIPALLVLSFGTVWLLRRRWRRSGARWSRAFVLISQGATLAVLLPALLVAPLTILGAVVFGPMG